jgi:hypothetical protein
MTSIILLRLQNQMLSPYYSHRCQASCVQTRRVGISSVRSTRHGDSARTRLRGVNWHRAGPGWALSHEIGQTIAMARRPVGCAFLPFIAEGRQIVRLAAGDQPLIDDDFLIDPFGTGIAKVGLERRPRGHLAAAHHNSLRSASRGHGRWPPPACRRERTAG